MVALVQRVREAAVSVEGEAVGEIQEGLLVLLGVGRGDGEAEADWLAEKVARLRVFPDGEGRMNRSLLETGGGALAVSQFTLLGDLKKGTRPSFAAAAPPDVAERLYRHFVGRLEGHLGRAVPTGRFGAAMDVRLTNWGPVTLWLERRPEGA